MNKEELMNLNKEEVKLSEEREKVIYFMLVIVFTLLIVAFIFSIPKFYNKSNLEDNTVVKIIDGDTFEYYDKDTNKIIKVRLLCINTPEEKEEGYEEAKNYLRSLILYKEIKMNASLADKDRYGRVLRYVYINEWGEDVLVNKLMIDEGYAELMVIPPENCNELKNLTQQ